MTPQQPPGSPYASKILQAMLLKPHMGASGMPCTQANKPISWLTCRRDMVQHAFSSTSHRRAASTVPSYR